MIPIRDHNPTSGQPFVTFTVIGLCILVFLWQLSLGKVDGQRAIYALGVIPAVLLNYSELPPEIALVPPEVTVLTSMFLHGGWLHLIGNMLYMWIFGDNVEDSMGHVRFAVFYLLCGTAAVFAQALPAPDSTIPMIGASGAISGVLGAYLLLHPHARVTVLVPIGFVLQAMRLPAVLVLGFYFVLNLISNFMDSGTEGGVAFRAHIGGFLAGVILIPLFKYRRVALFQPLRRR